MTARQPTLDGTMPVVTEPKPRIGEVGQSFGAALGSATPCDDPSYQAFVEEMARHCRCAPPHDCPCDGVMAGGLCDELGNEPDFTLDDLEWSEEYE